MQNSYAGHILSVKSLTLPMRSYTTVRFTNSAEQTLLQIPRTFSRLNSVMVTFYRPDGGPTGSSETNYMWAPPDTISTTVQCGSVKFPQNRYDGLKEAYLAILEGHRARSLRSSLGKRVVPRVLNSLLPVPLRSRTGPASSAQRAEHPRGSSDTRYQGHVSCAAHAHLRKFIP